MRLFGVTVAPVPEADPPDRDPSPNPPLAAREDVMRKCKSMSNLAAAGASVEGNGATDGYLSDDGLMQSSGKRRRLQERKKAVPWTEEEHRTFLAGLEKLGKGDWRGIAKIFVTTRTPTQVASHAQKYFLRQTNPNKKKRRSSLFDMMPCDTLPVPNCHIVPPSGTKVHDVVAMTEQLQNSKLEGVSSSNTANVGSRAGRDLPPIPPFKATSKDSSFSKLNIMDPKLVEICPPIPPFKATSKDSSFSKLNIMKRGRTPFPFRPIPRAPEGTSSIPSTANIATMASETNMTPCTTTFLSPKRDPSSPPLPKADSPEEKELELTVGPPSQKNMTNISSQNAVGVIQVI